MVKDEPGFMENVAFSEATIAVQEVHSKKRCRSDMSSQRQYRDDRVRETPRHNELFMLKEVLKAERESLCKLRIELEEERGASMTAANEAMAMITRLQEEKAAVLVEARRYKLAAEERESHNQEAIGLLKEALLTKEDDLLALHELLGAYRETLMGLGMEQGECLENRGCSDQLLLLEGPNAALSCVDPGNAAVYYGHKETICNRSGLGTNDDIHEECEFQDGSQYSNAFIHHDERKYKDTTERDCYTGGTTEKQGNIGSEDAYYEQQMSQPSATCSAESEKLKQSQEQALDDVSISIFARVKRLEERFEHLRQNQVLEYQRINVACQPDAVNSADLTSRERVETDWEATPKGLCSRKLLYDMEPEGLPAGDWDRGVHREQKVSKWSSFEKVRMDVRNQAQELGSLEHHEGCALGWECRQDRLNVQKDHNEQLASFSDINDDESEGVHDVYEVQSEVKKSLVHLPGKQCMEDNTRLSKFETGSLDASALHEADRDVTEVGLEVPRDYEQTEVCTTLFAKISIDHNPLDVKNVHTNVGDEDVQSLKVRLQALEDERFFMKQAIDSLRKENKELKVLQELAQQLRELNMDARRNKVTVQQGQPPFLTFLKGILSFTGFQRLASMEGTRCLLNSYSFSSKQRQDGLHHILDEGSESPKSVCVTRERKVKLNRT